jgi:hypothetical protein
VGFHPEGLQPVLRHAERLAALLFVYDLAPPSRDEAARLWLLGRAAEVERYAESVVDDWVMGRLDEGAAATALQRYVDAIHEGLGSMFGARAPSCCHARKKARVRRKQS